MTVQTVQCMNVHGAPKERFCSQQAARHALMRKRRFHNRRFPAIYKCECGGYHLTRGGEA